MINKLFPDAVIRNDFAPTGISNVIQAVGDLEILYVRAKTQTQLDSLIDLNLKESFQGLIVSPFIPTRPNLNYSQNTIQEIQKSEDNLIDHFYPVAGKEIPYVGVTGTNGKTSTCWYLMEMGRLSGANVLYMGTIGVFLAGVKKEDKILTTTPSLLSLRKLQHKYREEVDLIALEVSSHALEQGRLNGIEFAISAWTNFSQDHLDYHKDMETYFKAKLRITEYSTSKKIVVPSGETSLINRIKDSANVKVTNSLELLSGDFPESLGRGFSRVNLETAGTCLRELNLLKENISLVGLKQPPGRFQVLEKPSATFIVDYAHTPDALEKVLEQISIIYKERIVFTVFGCGGDRDKTKRPLMLRAALNNSNKVIVTSDNPRTEKPERIISDIVEENTAPLVEVDRAKAILKAYEIAKQTQSDVVILVAGKGDESYQEINGVRYDFSDTGIIKGL
jgi:UDP-N-acetylmuramoyl-L-alanyl-D-glutamate--2,6-diaminopimelate ligase